jgi:uncharacterized Zn finger protein
MPESVKCEACGEVHREVVLHSRCHLGSPMWATLNQENGRITLSCAECGEFVAMIIAGKGVQLTRPEKCQ